LSFLVDCIKLLYLLSGGILIRKYLPILFISLLSSQDIAGSYQFYGLYIIHQNLARYNTDITVSDEHGLNFTLPIDQIQAGEIYRTTYKGPYGHYYAQALGVILNVNFNEDGTGQIVEGSYYPIQDIEECITQIDILPITDALVFTSNLNANLTFPSTNILGSAPDGEHEHSSDGYTDGTALLYAGQEGAGSVSLSQTEFLDQFPSVPIHPTLCDEGGNCFDVILENGEIVSGGDPLPGFAGGYVKKGNLSSIAPSENECADMYIEWHAIDGPISGTGLGEINGEDEDGDGTDFDGIWSQENLIATYVNSSEECGGFNFPFYGDVTNLLVSMGLGDCIDRVDIAVQGYILDESLSNWGNVLTYNALNDEPSNDSDHDYNNTDGRLIMRFDPLCIQNINVRHVMLEFVEVGEGESCVSICNVGDMNSDSQYNVLDIVALANCVLANNCNGCEGDMNSDSQYNVLDIVALANCVLANNCSG